MISIDVLALNDLYQYIDRTYDRYSPIQDVGSSAILNATDWISKTLEECMRYDLSVSWIETRFQDKLYEEVRREIEDTEWMDPDDQKELIDIIGDRILKAVTVSWPQ